MAAFPPELIKNIAEQGTHQETKALRLVCHTYAALLQATALRKFTIHLDRERYHLNPSRLEFRFRALEWLAAEAETDTHPGSRLTTELVIDEIFLNDNEHARLGVCLGPAIRALKSVTKVYWETDSGPNSTSDALKQHYSTITQSLTPRLSFLTSLKMGAHRFSRDAANLTLLRPTGSASPPSFPNLNTLYLWNIDRSSRRDLDTVGQTVCVAPRICDLNVSLRMRSIRAFEASNRYTSPIPIQTFLPPPPPLIADNNNTATLTVQTLTLSTESRFINSTSPTLPHLPHLQCLTLHIGCTQHPLPLETTSKPAIYKHTVWDALKESGIKLRRLDTDDLCPSLIRYLSAYGGVLEVLAISHHISAQTINGSNIQTNASTMELLSGVAREFFNAALPLHAASLTHLSLNVNHEWWGTWWFGPGMVLAKSFPQPNCVFAKLEELGMAVMLPIAEERLGGGALDGEDTDYLVSL
ncbi:hypothetical protein FA15DRAFT_273808 [Coprinopsis marcescibilis]|uniref:F-box domain-containing protein n=1 Tax=Coprinopsis marcescibilis TaxID=230819 RepID=A0A5C3KDQ4_COPMA|nr:hypothetical protein FA15DRAFT_273808 [Coprinopsis marcescibilis]